MAHRIPPAETTLLADLLATSEALYHRCVAAIQKVFAERWFELLHDRIGAEQIEDPGANPAMIEARARYDLRHLRRALRQRQEELIGQQQERRANRDAGIRAYAASKCTNQQPAAA